VNLDRTNMKRVLAIGLDGYEPSLGDRLMAEGEMPALARIRERSARFVLDHGPAQRTGLAWEHVATGLAPEAAHRASAVRFDPRTYDVCQEGAILDPFAAHIDARTVVFDTPYFDLERAPNVRGVVGWGAHDPGLRAGSNPRELVAEFAQRFGPYPADEWLYGIVWASERNTRAMGEALVRATEARAAAAAWLLGERLSDWDLAIVVAGELHSAIEGLWHGLDPAHALHALPSSKPAGELLREVHRATDRLIARLSAACPDAALVVFAMGGMGRNHSDPSSMVLLPELLYRCAFSRPLLQPRREWSSGEGIPMLGEDENWSVAINACIPDEHSLGRKLRDAISRRLYGYEATAIGSHAQPNGQQRRALRLPLDWMPAERYRPRWPEMRFFALPSFYDGRVRINLIGRERKGKVTLADYRAVCDEIEALVRECRDPVSGAPVVEAIERTGGADPLALEPAGADLVIIWRIPVLALEHPTLGRIGPVPHRRPGGHTGRYGMAYLCNADGLAVGDFGMRSSFDVVPTLVDLTGAPVPSGLSGTSLLDGRSTHDA
jgi:predicted AlkP superfamily phosphohydrolase/phosphomutase